MRDRIKQDILNMADSTAPVIEAANDALWEFAELALEENRSSAYLRGILEKNGFRILPGAEGVPTSFIAEYGAGSPVIGLIAEYDALPGMSQEKSPVCRPRQEGAPGHACGHCALGAAVLGAALVLKDCMARQELPGTIRFYGCPAEETVEGKVLMSRDHLFDSCDAALSWHPNDISYVWARKSVALTGMRYTFHGTSAHAGLDPWNGRSALDAVELMNVGANYLREHIQPSCRFHYAITDGGRAPNTVPDRAQVWYAMRGPSRQAVEEIRQRLGKIARGAALMTETDWEETYVSGCYDFMPNMAMAQLLLDKMREVGAPRWTPEDRTFAKALFSQIPQRYLDETCSSFGLGEGDLTDGLVNGIYDGYYRGGSLGASTDLGDVSWQIPVGCFSYASTVVGSPGHSWFYTAACGAGLGARGAQAAAKVLALAGYELLTDSQLLRDVKEEHIKALSGARYNCPIQ